MLESTAIEQSFLMATPTVIFVVVAISFFNAVYNAAIGPTGGTMIVGFASVLPPQLALLLHAIGNIIGASQRSLSYFKYLEARQVAIIILGLAVGLALGMSLFQHVPEWALQLTIATVMLLLAWTPWPKVNENPALYKIGLASFFGSAINLFAPTAVLMAAFCSRYFENRAEPRKAMLAHVNLWSFIQNAAKIIFFSTIMVVNYHTAALLAALVLVSMLVGHQVGLRLAGKLSEKLMKRVLKITVTGFALVLLGQAAKTLLNL